MERMSNFYESERLKAVRLLENVPDDKLLYVIGFLEGASIPEEHDPFYSAANMERLRHSIRQMEATGGTPHEVFYDE